MYTAYNIPIDSFTRACTIQSGAYFKTEASENVQNEEAPGRQPSRHGRLREQRSFAHLRSKPPAAAVVGRAQRGIAPAGRPPAGLPAARGGGDFGNRGVAAQGILAPEDPARITVSSEGYGKAPQ